MRHFITAFLLLVLGTAKIFASHNRAGEITYQHVAGFTYFITITTYTKESSTAADRCELTIKFGDGDTAVFQRVNGSNFLCPGTAKDGISLGSDTKMNIYTGYHTYPGPGTYVIGMEDMNRNSGICNIPGSFDMSFYIQTVLVINPLMPPNSSPTLLNPPIDNACVGQCFEHNPGAYDAEGDSLHYYMTTCYANGAPILGYTLPPNFSSSSINPKTGDVTWCTPPVICQYNIAFVIEEWKLLPGTARRYFSGSVLRDMQIDVVACSNTAPTINAVADTCILANSLLTFPVTASDADNNTLTLSATGGPFSFSPPATFTSVSGIGTASGTFSWTPSCDQIQLLPYLVTFKANDNDLPTNLVNFESVNIRVIAPPPTAVSATPSGASMIVSWTAPFCNALVGPNPLKKYLIYRKDACDPWIPDPCETGVPAYTGYTFIGSVNAPATTFTDNNGGSGLTHGTDYSYIVVAQYADGSQSLASTNDCAQLVRDVPIITNVSVLSTGTNDSIWTHWVKPLGIAPNLDTLTNPPPYEYRLMQATGMSGTLTYTQVASYTYGSYSALTDTGFVSTGLNTQDNSYTYRVDFYSNGLLKGSTHTASSVFVSSTQSDNTVNLTWSENVPWNNYRYDVYRALPATPGVFVFLDSTTSPSYTDTALVNGLTYCYKVISYGEYSDTLLPRPLVNHSQERCETPLDRTPPCQPNLVVASDCGQVLNSLIWQNPNNTCSDDALSYNIYFTPVQGDPMTLIYSSTDLNDTTFTHFYEYEGVPSIAGCYAITAVDSSGNESAISTMVCVDNCPAYELPNVFTPNGDGSNDFFIPLQPYRYVKDIDITIYDRWGLVMFQTNNPDIMWDGTSAQTGLPCPDGTYFYTCTVNEIRLEGIVPRGLKGFITLLKEKTSPTN